MRKLNVIKEPANNETPQQPQRKLFNGYVIFSILIIPTAILISNGTIPFNAGIIIASGFVILTVTLKMYRLFNQFMWKREEKRNTERKNPVLQTLGKDMSEGSGEIRSLIDRLSANIQKLEESSKTFSTRQLVKEYKDLYSNNQDTLHELNQIYSKAQESINSSKCSEWKHLMNFRQILQEKLKQCKEDEEKMNMLKSTYKLSPEAILAENTRQIAEGLKLQLPNTKTKLRHYKLPVQKVKEHDQIRRYEYGHDTGKQHKYMMMVGMTGAGKSLLINNMVNYVYGVQHSDDFRFKLIVESEEIKERSGDNDSQAISMTSHVSAFTLHHQKGFRIPYSLTIIDTPGFGDTRGIEYDEMIVKQIKQFFSDERICGSSEITCIGMVMQSSQARITTEQKYIVDSVLQLFAKDIEDNIFMFFTFADGQPPPVIEVLKEEKIPHAKGKYYKFNNSALYAEDKSDFFWKFGYDSLEKLFYDLVKTDSKSLNLTKKNLEERERLRNTLEKLKPQIDSGIIKLDTIQQETEMLKKIKTDIATSKNHNTEITVEVEDPEDVSHSITNCYECHNTCHDPCSIEGDMKERCAAIGPEGQCKVCPQKCHWEKHRNGTCRYNRVLKTKVVTAEDVLKKYNISIKDKDAKKKTLIKLVEDYQKHKTQVFALIKEANGCSNRLDEIALRPSFLSNVQYIDRLIETEEKRNKNIKGKGQRLKQLRNMRDLAQLFHDCSTNSLDNKIAEQEDEIQRIMLEALDGIDDDQDYHEAKEEVKKGFVDKMKGLFSSILK